jgi:phage terminase large subunit-like protein
VPSEGADVIRFIEANCRHVKGKLAKELIRLEPWQKQLIIDTYELNPDTGKRRYREALWGEARKNGKSVIAAALGLYHLLLDEPYGAEVYSVAGAKDQARLVFDMARSMVRLDPELSELLELRQYTIENVAAGGVWKYLSADADLQEGLNPSFVVFDELHVQPNDQLYNTMRLGMGAREQPLLLSITTAGVRTDRTGRDSICYRMYQHGKRMEAGEVEDPTFFFRWFEPKNPDCTIDDELAWQEANPNFGVSLNAEEFRSAIVKTPEPEFRTKRLNQWVSSMTAWLPHGRLEALYLEQTVEPNTPIVVGFDGSISRDSTALIGCTLDPVPHLFSLGVWERPQNADPEWTVPSGEVLNRIVDVARTYQVREFTYDPSYWRERIEELEPQLNSLGVVCVEYPNTIQRMAPAAAAFYARVMEGNLSHDNDPTLLRHFRNCVAKDSPKGPYPSKESKSSPRKIDAAIAALMAVDRAAHLANESDEDPFFLYA